MRFGMRQPASNNGKRRGTHQKGHDAKRHHAGNDCRDETRLRRDFQQGARRYHGGAIRLHRRFLHGREFDEAHDGEDNGMNADQREIGRQIQRQHLIMRKAHNARPDNAGHHTARRHPGNCLGAIGIGHQFHRRETIHLQAGHRITKDQAAQAHQREGRGIEPKRHHRAAHHAEDRTDPKTKAPAHTLHQRRGGEDRDHDTQMLQGDRERGEVSVMVKGHHGKRSGGEHQRIAGLANGLTTGQEKKIPPRGAVEHSHSSHASLPRSRCYTRTRGRERRRVRPKARVWRAIAAPAPPPGRYCGPS